MLLLLLLGLFFSLRGCFDMSGSHQNSALKKSSAGLCGRIGSGRTGQDRMG
jgi:hypothetical protein